MFDHVEIQIVNFEACKAFYSNVLRPLKIEIKWSDEAAAGFGLVGEDKVRFLIELSDTSCKSHIAFKGRDEVAIKEFHRTGVELGFDCNGPPGLRQNYAPNYYAAFLLDPDGNNIEAVAYL